MIAVDTSAMAAILFDESDALVFSQAVSRSQCLISAGTLIECHKVIGGRFGLAGVEMVRTFIAENEILPIAVTEDHVSAAAMARLNFGRGTGHRAQLNFGDCFAYALAKTRNIPLLFKGDDFIHTDIVSALPQAAP